jgi:hypothetical protein
VSDSARAPNHAVNCGEQEDETSTTRSVVFVVEEKLANRLKAAFQNAAELSGAKKEPF